MITLGFEVVATGPIFDGRADKAAEDYRDAIERELSRQGVRLVRSHLGTVLKHPTGNYSAHITDRSVPEGRLVTDQRVVYGPWLEGVGSRNRTTRFKGYSTFRIAAGQLSRSATYYAGSIIGPYLHRMGGGAQ